MSRLNKLVQESVRPKPARRLPLDESLLEMLWKLKCGVDEAELRSRNAAEATLNERDSAEEVSAN